jgi:hypothetical protein
MGAAVRLAAAVKLFDIKSDLENPDSLSGIP